MNQDSAVAGADDPSREGGEATQNNALNNGAGDHESIGVRMDHLEAKQEQYVEGFLEGEVRRRLEDLEDQVAELQSELESVAGVSDGEPSTKEKRAIDLAMALIRRARNRADEDRYAMWKDDVKDALLDLGHGPDIHKPWIYDAMEAVATAPGFGWTTITNPDGREVKAVKVNLAELPSESRSAVSNDITTGMDGPPAQLPPKTEPNTTET